MRKEIFIQINQTDEVSGIANFSSTLVVELAAQLLLLRLIHHDNCSLESSIYGPVIRKQQLGTGSIAQLTNVITSTQDTISPCRHSLFLRRVIFMRAFVKFVGGSKINLALIVVWKGITLVHLLA